MKRRLSKNFSSLYKARNRFIVSQPTINKNKKFGEVKTSHGSLKFGLSKEEDQWLKRLNVPMQAVPIQGFTDLNTKKKKVYIADGYNPSTNTIYEFLGNRYHGHPMKFNPLVLDKQIGKTYGQLYNETLQRFYTFHCLGYKVIFVWESDYKKGSAGRYYKGKGDNLL